MKVVPSPRVGTLVGVLLLALSQPSYGIKVWTNSLSGLWQDGTNWLEQVPPDITSSVLITNDVSKTITINQLTPATNLTVQRLTLNAPPGATNTLLLSDVGAENPLTCQTGLEMQDGAALQITNSALLLQLTNDHVNIDGTLELDSGSLDFGDTTVTARVGRVTSGVLTINGGVASLGTVTVGGLGNSTGAVYLNGGQLHVSSLLSVGRNPATTGALFMAGGLLTVTNDDTKVGDGGIGQMTISNATAVLTNLDVGHDTLASGTLTVATGAVVILSNNMTLGVSSQSTGMVFVTGGQIAAAGQKIKVGPAGFGQFSVSNGTVQASDLLLSTDPTNAASGTLSMTGGSLGLSGSLVVGGVSNSAGVALVGGGDVEVTNSAGTATLSVPNGSVTLSAGTLTTDNLLLTNATGQIIFNGGTINTKATSVANGAAFVVGNGVLPATLHLNGGTHVFSGGLTIASNATLSGCGTIIGTIINHGTIATNCATLVAPRITGIVRTGTTNTISFTSVIGQTYTLEYKNTLRDTSWTALPGLAAGTGAVMSLRDTTASLATRFYHVRTQ
jgi:hypothetical protein